MKRLVHTLVALLGCLHLCGGHWGVIQVVAWANMLVDYSAQDGLLTGAKRTFDGENPCSMCNAIQDGKKQESESNESKLQQLPQGLALKDCLNPPVVTVTPPPPRDCVALSSPEFHLPGHALGYRPPVPPPRCA